MASGSQCGVCCCCLAEGNFKSLSHEYKWLNTKEVYGDMLRECLGINIPEEAPSECQICGVCITRLRDASNFKQQVLFSQQQLETLRLRIKADNDVSEPDKKIKPEQTEDDFGNNWEIPTQSEEDMADMKLEDLDSQTVQDSTGDPPQDTPVHRSRRTKIKELESECSGTRGSGKIITKKERQYTEPSIKAMTATKRNRLMKMNAVLVLESSTVIPFKWQRQNYLCFFCHLPFKDPNMMKDHTTSEHRGTNIRTAVMYLRRDELVKVDVTKISCKMCTDTATDLSSFKLHLKAVHSKNFSDSPRDGLVPYKLKNDFFQCAVCSEKFQYFTKLNQHMNKHFGNYVCESCGKCFLSRERLRVHALGHSLLKCNECEETFQSMTQKANHCTSVHNKAKLKCSFCSETFANYSQRKKHHKSAHNISTPEYKCPVCCKSFQIMSKMSVHVKAVHMREKNFSCNVCEQKFFSRSHVEKHMIKHYGDRIHHCQICKKSYARKQTLRDHMKIHNDDRRFVCSICSQRFLQNNSLKLHTRVHHPDVVSA